RHFRVHQRSTSICKYYLTGDPVCLRRTKESHDISNIGRRAKSTHWCPTLLMSVANQFLHRLGQRVKHAIFRPTWTDGIDRCAHVSQTRRQNTAPAIPVTPRATDLPARRFPV